MIRLVAKSEIKELGQLWLRASLRSHDFIPEEYWRQKLPSIEVKYLGGSLVYVYLTAGAPVGFIALVKKGFIGGLFVEPSQQGRGVGRALLTYAQELFNHLELDVYARNTRAVKFYQQAGFYLVATHQGDETGEESLRLRWDKDAV